MQLRILLGITFASMMAVSGCGSDGGDGPPGSGGVGNDDSGMEEEPAPNPGTCRRLCCSSADCSSGETCTAFNTSWGTLGTCSGGGWGVDAGGDTDGGTGTTLPAGCWTLNEAKCNPIAQTCTAPGDVCDYNAQEDPAFDPVVECFSDPDALNGAGDECDDYYGPTCLPAFHCVTN